jgi:hypothetical protein
MTRVLGSARIFLVTLALSAALSSCAAMAAGEPRCNAEVEADSNTGLAAEGESSTIRYCFVVGEDVALINLQIHVRIAEGRVGTWQLEVSAEDLIGGYHWSWSAGR